MIQPIDGIKTVLIRIYKIILSLTVLFQMPQAICAIRH